MVGREEKGYSASPCLDPWEGASQIQGACREQQGFWGGEGAGWGRGRHSPELNTFVPQRAGRVGAQRERPEGRQPRDKARSCLRRLSPLPAASLPGRCCTPLNCSDALCS